MSYNNRKGHTMILIRDFSVLNIVRAGADIAIIPLSTQLNFKTRVYIFTNTDIGEKQNL
jgi:hypothetical protein